MAAAREKELKTKGPKIQQDLDKAQSKLHDLRGELERSQSQLGEVLGELEQTHFELHQSTEKQSESDLEVKKDLQKQKSSESKLEIEKANLKQLQVGKTDKLPGQSDEGDRLFEIKNAVVKAIDIQEQHNKWFGGVVFPNYMPEIFRHRRADSQNKIVYLDDNIETNNSSNVKVDDSEIYSGRYIYAGPFHAHFGHALTESIHRLWAFDANIYDGVVFAISLWSNESKGKYTFPIWFAQILEIIGVPLSKCVLVTDSCIFENLTVPEPGSELTLGAKKWYRSYLKKLQQRIWDLTHDLRKDKPDQLFLGRNHIPFSGIIAGEKYFETLLIDEGYVSLKPENYDVLEQLAYLINAKRTVFSEGSSIYLLELIDYLDAEIACIPRRTGNQCFYPHVYSKCRSYIIAGDIKALQSLTDWTKHGIRKPLRINQEPYKIVESLRKHNFCSLKNWDWNQFLAEEKHYVATYINRAYGFLPNQDPAHRVGVMQKYLQVRGTHQDQSTSQVSNDMQTKSRSDRLNKLASINQSSRYLEIGVSQGITFNAIEIDYKVAVDPHFQLDREKYANDKVVFLEVSSDEFFRSYAKDFEPFDLIYLDGLHIFEQTFRDFCASVACGHSKTIWLIDDTCPRSYAQAQSSLQSCRQIKKFLGERDISWMGDVFKVVAAIHDFFPQYSFATFPDHGQTVVWNQWRTDFDPRWNSLEAISRLEYSDFVELQGTIFKRESYESIFEKIRQDISES